MTGGLVSIGVIVVIIVGFANMIMETIHKTAITTSSKTMKNIDPNLTTLITSPEHNFMFGVEIWHHDLNGPKRYFDVAATATTELAGTYAPSVPIPLVPCTR